MFATCYLWDEMISCDRWPESIHRQARRSQPSSAASSAAARRSASNPGMRQTPSATPTKRATTERDRPAGAPPSGHGREIHHREDRGPRLRHDPLELLVSHGERRGRRDLDARAPRRAAARDRSTPGYGGCRHPRTRSPPPARPTAPRASAASGWSSRQDDRHRLVAHGLLVQPRPQRRVQAGEPAEGGVEPPGEHLARGAGEPALEAGHQLTAPGRVPAPGAAPGARCQPRRVEVDEQRPGPARRRRSSSSWAASTRRAYGSSRSPSAGQRHLPGGPYEELGAQLPLQPPDVAAQRLLGDVEPGGGAGEVQLLGDGDEGAQEAGVEVVIGADIAATLTTRSASMGADQVLDAVTAPGDGRRMPHPLDPHRAPTPRAAPVRPAPDAAVIARLQPRTRHAPRPRPPGPYRRLFAVPGTRAFTAGNLLARLPMGMFSVSAVIMIAGARGSYALAGAVTATGLAATAVVAPWTAGSSTGTARPGSPYRPPRSPSSVPSPCCCAYAYGAPAWTLFAAYAATATTPNTGGMSRARWAHLCSGDRGAAHRELLRAGRRRAVLHARPGPRRVPVRGALPGGGHAGRRGPAADRRAALRRPARHRAAGDARARRRPPLSAAHPRHAPAARRLPRHGRGLRLDGGRHDRLRRRRRGTAPRRRRPRPPGGRIVRGGPAVRGRGRPDPRPATCGAWPR